ncbi:MAG: two-partner secretion domain-containing protein [Polaromonas sp.]|uniref:two-partner secretion domain-containing protein n=1 Tax=Polaromonas sp. TaxID=1869339 RepID=UPI004035D31F
MTTPLRRQRLSLLAAAAILAVHVPSLAQTLAAGTLPGGWNVTSGSAAIVKNGTTLTINQTSQQAIVNFGTFSVGSAATVDIRQISSSAALLARVTGGDPSLIQGQVRANGALWLINQAGILVGPGARIDVARLIASTLNVSDSDFLANRLNFRGVGTPGEVRNEGTIRAASGGSIYLVGPQVSNSGSLNAPAGEVLLAAGQTVQLMDTGTPGVSVAITGTPGEVRNLGQISAEAGRIGLAAGLISNSGTISASSAVREGGRIFLRASGDIRTSASSNIRASGTTGGRVVLVAGQAASLDGDIAATGSTGPGGYVDTSGTSSLDVVRAPVVGQGGEWHIDPFNIEIVAGGPDGGVSVAGNAITSNETGAHIAASTITDQLNAGTSVSITTGAGSPMSPGDITVSSAIGKTSGTDAALTLNAHNNIIINADITSSAGVLDLNLNSNFQNSTPGADHAVQLNASVALNGGALAVSQDGGANNGTLTIAGGTTTLAGGSGIKAAAVNVLAGGTLAGEGTIELGGTGTLTNHGVLTLGTTSGYGRVTVQGNYTQGSTGALNVKLGDSDGFDVLAVEAAASLNGRLNVRGFNSFVPTVGATFNVLAAAGPGNSGTFSTVNAPDLTAGGRTASLAVSYPNTGGTLARVTARDPAAAQAAAAAAAKAAADAAAKAAADAAAKAAASAAANMAAQPVSQALNTTVNLINSQSIPTRSQPGELTPAQVAAMPVSIPATNSEEPASADGKDIVATAATSGSKTDPVKKTFCN